MAAPLVKINSDSAKEIAGLYGIGSDLAERVVAYREANGYLHTPEELSKVESVSKSLAVTLAPHVDWSEPREVEEGERSIFSVLSGVLILGFLLAFDYRNVWPQLLDILDSRHYGFYFPWYHTW